MLQYACLIFTEVLEMENKKTCADCINLGREVYCMKCKRLKNGYKDLFVDAAPVQAKPPVASKKQAEADGTVIRSFVLFRLFQLIKQAAFRVILTVALLGFD